MNILILNWRDPKNPKAGGAEVVTHEYAKGWVKAGHKVTVFASIFRNAKNEEIIDGVHIIRKGISVFDVQLKAFAWYTFQEHEKFDLVIDQFHGIPFFTPLYVRVKKIAFIHEVAKDVWKLNPWPKPLNLIPYFIGTTLEPFIFKLFYKTCPFITVSQSTKDDLIAWGIPHEKITILYNGIIAPQNSPVAKKEKNKTIMFLGAISEDKGIVEALSVFSYLKKKDESMQFWIVGKGDEKLVTKLKRMSKKYEIEKNITFWGYVDTNTKFSLLARSHLLFNPSIREGWGLVIIEAASQATPSVVYNVPGLKDSVRDNVTGIIVKQRKAEITAQEISDLLSDNKRYKIFQKNCLHWAKEFNWKVSVTKSLNFIETICKTKNK